MDLTRQASMPTWTKAIAQPASEFPPTPLPALSGQIPTGLRGSLYRNGPGRLERASSRVGHWFDGDGAILAVHFTDQGATGLYRYVQTAGYQAEAAAGHYLYGNYGMTAPGPIWNQWLRPLKNAANTSVLPLPDKLLALWEGGNPHALDLEDLATLGVDYLGGLKQGEPYSAHYKRDPATGEVFNFGVVPGINAKLHLYKSDRSGKVVQRASVPLEGMPLIHDFVLAGPYLVFFIPAVRLNSLPVLAGLSSYSDAMQWRPDKATGILVLDRETLSVVSRGETEPWFQWHFGNGCVDASGCIRLDFVQYADFQTNQFLKEVPTGHPQTAAPGTLWRVRLAPQTGQIQELQEVLEQPCEFPVVDPQQVGQEWRYTYLSVHLPGVDIRQELFGAIARYDYQTGNLVTAEAGENCYPMEPLYIPDAQTSEHGWVMTVVYDGNTNSSEVWIYDSDRLADEPVCRLGLPSVIPFGFHGKWRPASFNGVWRT